MKKCVCAGLLPAVLAFGGASALAQSPKPQHLLLHQEVAKPSRVRDYETSMKEFVALVKKHKALMPLFSFEAIASPDFTYGYVTPIRNLGDLDTILAEFGALTQATGPTVPDLMKRAGDATDHVRDSVIVTAPELSYAPATPRLKPEEMPYRHFDLYYLRPGTEPEADAVAADFQKLFKAKAIPDGYTLYKVVLGPDMPLYVVTVGALDAADYHAQDAKMRTTLGAEGAALFGRAFALTRRFETREGTFRPDLSLGK
jgi:hypothetical protein